MFRWLVLTASMATLAACPGDRQLPPAPGVDGASLPPDGPGARRDGPPAAQDGGGVGREAGSNITKTCQGAGYTFTAHGELQPCSQLKITVQGPGPLVWVLVGVQGPGSAISWVGGVIDASCSGGSCSWTFPGATIPCEGGSPYSLHFMKDAVDDNSGVGQEIASCSP